ncbi:hypothetical protein [Oceanibium sediminis]|uniref:FliH/SctL family protein n=1 Tax=Oceanibium sediminis TaxID=2026339 RepID=UPI000DD353CF|nr:hypothetical protein [Oceanibium sediminis]
MPLALKLQEFLPGEGAHPAPDTPDIAAVRAEAFKEGYAQGSADGTKAAAEAHAEAQDQLRAALVERLHDQYLSRNEVEASILAGITPFVSALIDHLSPRLTQAGLADQVASAVAHALDARPDAKPILRCSEESLPGLQSALSDWVGLKVVADPRLTPLEAEVHWDDGFDAIDLSGVLARIDAAFEAFAQNPQDDETLDVQPPQPAMKEQTLAG